MTNNVYVIGAGKLGCQIANNLSKEGFNVTIVDLTNEVFNKIQDFSGFTRVADVTNPSALDNFNLDTLSMLIAVTGDDNKNIFIADMCNYMVRIKDIYIRLYDSNKEKLITSENIHSICPFLLSIKYFDSLKIQEKNWYESSNIKWAWRSRLHYKNV